MRSAAKAFRETLTRRTRVAILIGAATLAAWPALVPVVEGQASKTIWDGVYTEAQAERGAERYATDCASCHGDGLGGVESAPALVGAAFYANWEGESLDALAERMRVSMPPNAPGSLSRTRTVEILAHILKAGGYPSGTTALGDQPGALIPIRVLTYKPQ